MAKQIVIEKDGKKITLETLEAVERYVGDIALVMGELSHYLSQDHDSKDVMTIVLACIEKAGYLADRANGLIGTNIIIGDYAEWLSFNGRDGTKDNEAQTDEVAHV